MMWVWRIGYMNRILKPMFFTWMINVYFLWIVYHDEWLNLFQTLNGLKVNCIVKSLKLCHFRVLSIIHPATYSYKHNSFINILLWSHWTAIHIKLLHKHMLIIHEHIKSLGLEGLHLTKWRKLCCLYCYLYIGTAITNTTIIATSST